MKRNLFILVALALGFLGLISLPANAKTGLTLIGAAYRPNLETVLEGGANQNLNSNTSVPTLKDHGPGILAFGVGLIGRGPHGGASRLLYTYRKETEMMNESGLSVGLSTPNTSNPNGVFNFSLHMLNLSLMHHFGIIPSLMSLYLGGGFGAMVFVYPRETNGVAYSPGVMAYPLGGVELRLGGSIGLYGEFQYHWGRTLNQSFEPFPNTNETVETTKYYYKLKGPNIMGGVNLYF